MTLQDELAHALEERERLDVVIEYLQGRLNGATAKPAVKERQRKGKLTAAAAAERVLRSHDGPMRTPELLLGAQALGAQIKDTDGLYKTLLRNPQFERAGRGLWKLTG